MNKDRIDQLRAELKLLQRVLDEPIASGDGRTSGKTLRRALLERLRASAGEGTSAALDLLRRLRDHSPAAAQAYEQALKQQESNSRYPGGIYVVPKGTTYDQCRLRDAGVMSDEEFQELRRGPPLDHV